MIRRWLHALRAWLWAPLWELDGRTLDQVQHCYNHLLLINGRLKSIEEALEHLGAALIPPTTKTTFAATPLIQRWDCGHDHQTGARDREGVTWCLACHEARQAG